VNCSRPTAWLVSTTVPNNKPMPVTVITMNGAMASP